jgi:hypothetical protein
MLVQNGEPIKKSDVVRQLVTDKQYKKALKIAKDFRLGINKSDSDAMKLGYECMVSPGLYEQIDVNVDEAVIIAINTIRNLYGKAVSG